MLRTLPGSGSKRAGARPEERTMSILDDYMVVPGISLLDKVRIQAQVLVPLMRTLRAELGR